MYVIVGLLWWGLGSVVHERVHILGERELNARISAERYCEQVHSGVCEWRILTV